MGVTRKVISWCDKKYEEATKEPDNRKAGVKAFVSGCVEGFADAAIILYIPLLIGYNILNKLSDKK